MSKSSTDGSLSNQSEQEIQNIEHNLPAFSVASHLEKIQLNMSLQNISSDLRSLERMMRNISPTEKRDHILLEFARILFGGWPVLTLIFLFMFYTPLKDALSLIPEKVKSAQEIGLLGLSLKSTIRIEAAKVGDESLSNTIPTLSAKAIDILVRAPRQKRQLVSFSPIMSKDGREQYNAVFLPNEKYMNAVWELVGRELAEIGLRNEGTISEDQAKKVLEDFSKSYKGSRPNPDSADTDIWIFSEPVDPNLQVTDLYWNLTEKGRQAVDVILKSLSIQLSPPETVKK